jgi:hypothetical protein
MPHFPLENCVYVNKVSVYVNKVSVYVNKVSVCVNKVSVCVNKVSVYAGAETQQRSSGPGLQTDGGQGTLAN